MHTDGTRVDGPAAKIHYIACGVDLAESSGGPIIHVAEAIDQLRELGRDVELLGLYSSPPHYLRCPWRGRPMSRLPFLRHVLNTWRLLLLMRGRLRRGGSAMYIRWGTGGPVATLFARALGIPYWIEMNGIYHLVRLEHSGGLANRVKARLSVWLETRAIRAAAGVFTTTAQMADYYARTCDLDRCRVVPNPCGVNPATHPLSASLRLQGDGNAAPVVGFAGGLWHQTGIDTLIEAAQHVVDRLPDVRFKIIGGSDQEQEYQQQARESGVGDKFHFVGRIPYYEVAEQLAEVDVAVAPYNSTPNLDRIGGGSPQKVYSYLACGKITIISDLPYYSHFKACPACFFFRPGDAADLARVILDTLRLEPAQARELGEAARNYVLEHYTWRHNAERIIEALLTSRESLARSRVLHRLA